MDDNKTPKKTISWRRVIAIAFEAMILGFGWTFGLSLFVLWAGWMDETPLPLMIVAWVLLSARFAFTMPDDKLDK